MTLSDLGSTLTPVSFLNVSLLQPCAVRGKVLNYTKSWDQSNPWVTGVEALLILWWPRCRLVTSSGLSTPSGLVSLNQH